MTYASFKNHSGEREIVDEVRKVQDGLYLGLAVWDDPRDGQRRLLGPFVLAGPTRAWVGVDNDLVERFLEGGEPLSASAVDPATSTTAPSIPSGDDGRPVRVTEVTPDTGGSPSTTRRSTCSTPTSSRPCDCCSIGSKRTRTSGCSCSTQRILTTTSRIWT